MKTHNSKSVDRRVIRRRNRRVAIYATVLILIITAVLLAIILPITLRNAPPVVGPPPTGTEPPGSQPGPGTIPEPQPTMVLPLESFTVGKQASLNRLVFHSSMNHWRTHDGVNLQTQRDSTVRSIMSGEVIKVEDTLLEGGIVEVRHANGYVSRYMGLNSNIAVEVGQEVAMGETLGTIAAARARARSEGSHLHLQIERNGIHIDPMTLLDTLEESK